MKLRSLLPVVLLSSTFAMAGPDQEQKGSQQLEALKDKCADLLANQQIKPFKIQVTCSETSHVWKMAKPGAFGLPNLREVGASARMKNFEFPFVGNQVAAADTTASCHMLERYKITVPAVDVELSCAELDAIDNFTEFCTPIINERVKQDPGIVLAEKTGEIYSTCAGSLTK